MPAERLSTFDHAAGAAILKRAKSLFKAADSDGTLELLTLHYRPQILHCIMMKVTVGLMKTNLRQVHSPYYVQYHN